VGEMNFISQLLREQIAPGENGEDGGPLAGDLFVRGIKNRLSSMSTTPIPGFDNEDIYLSNFGVQTQLDGSLTINKTTFDKYIAANPDHFRALTTSGVSTSVNGLSGSVLGTNYTPGDYNFSLSGGTATLGGTTLLADTSGSTNRYTSTSGSTAGVTVETNLSSLTATVFVGKSFIENINEYLSAVLSSSTQQGDIDTKINTLTSEVRDYEDQLTDLSEEMEKVRTLYREKFTAMEQAVAGFKKTGTFLENMMDAWSASMK
jgi:flagellar hook-associated protein 2